MKAVLRSRDLTCPTCVAKIERALSGMQGVEGARVHFTTGRIEVWYDPARVNVDDMLRTIRSGGYEATAALLP
ncbi:MAG TPA: heavy metal-associated domain-containing protein [Chloroflexota bacterium]|jgi:copper chaperone CopZ|nr:heavy metal-associated domain-containing protein [Chloroflexota bacterium]